MYKGRTTKPTTQHKYLFSEDRTKTITYRGVQSLSGNLPVYFLFRRRVFSGAGVTVHHATIAGSREGSAVKTILLYRQIFGPPFSVYRGGKCGPWWWRWSRMGPRRHWFTDIMPFTVVECERIFNRHAQSIQRHISGA